EEHLKNMRNPSRKVLILGTSDSGKTTLVRQLVILHGGGYSDKDRENYRGLMISKLRVNYQLLLMADEDDTTVPDQERISSIRHSQFFPTASPLTPEEAVKMKELWTRMAAQESFYSICRECVIEDTAPYYFEKVDVFTNPDYLPTNDADILHLRHPTSNISEYEFQLDDYKFKFYDVAGQVDKRYRWAPYFEQQMSAIVYVVSISSFDQLLAEDNATNRLIDSLALFETLSQHELLKKTSIIVLLNKFDLLVKKCARGVNLKSFIPYYAGANEPKDFIKFCSKEFIKKGKTDDETKVIAIHVTTCTDSKLMKKIILDVKYL
ncbi:guanine nucleotide binding protein, alpha subunit, partial [Gorgonomyces haynaldii]